MKRFKFAKIKEYRKAAGLTQAQLAKKVGVAVQQISAWENSGLDKTITAWNLGNIANAVGRETGDFYV